MSRIYKLNSHNILAIGLKVYLVYSIYSVYSIAYRPERSRARSVFTSALWDLTPLFAEKF